MNTKIFVNLPVKDLNKSMEFFQALGYTFNKQFTDATAACLVISEDIYAMLLTHAKFKQFTPREICNASESTEMMICLSCENRGQVDDLVRKAVAAGGTAHSQPEDYGFMYQHGFEDPDSHQWGLIYMNPSYVQKG
jgi:uncharacterized protein